MKFRTYLKLASNILLHSKIRSWLTILGIIIGVGSVVSIVSLGDSMEQDIQSRLDEMDLTTISISPGYTRAGGGFGGGFGGGGTTLEDTELTDDDIDAIKNIDGILYISGEISGTEDVSYAGDTASISVTGVDPQVWQYMTTSDVETGRLLEPADKNVAVIGSGLATDVFDRDIGVNQMISVNGKSIRVVGITESEGGFSDTGITMPIDVAVDVIEDAEDDVFDTIAVKAESTEVVDAVVEEIEEKLMISRHINNEDDRDFSVTASMSMADSVTEMTGTITLFLSAIAGISLLVGAVGIANTMFTSVLERTKDIGTMKAIGAKNRDILMIFIVNSALVGLVGGVLGVILAAMVTSLFPMLLGISSGISPSLILLGLGIAVGIGVVSGVIPAYNASKMKPVDALRYE